MSGEIDSEYPTHPKTPQPKTFNEVLDELEIAPVGKDVPKLISFIRTAMMEIQVANTETWETLREIGIKELG